MFNGDTKKLTNGNIL